MRAAQQQGCQPVKPDEDVFRQDGERIAPQIQFPQRAQAFKVSAPERADSPVAQIQHRDPAQLVQGDRRAGVQAGCHPDGVAHHGGAVADADSHLEGEPEAGGVGVKIGGGQGEHTRQEGKRRRAGQGAGVHVKTQTGGQGTAEGVDQGTVAAVGSRQAQDRNGDAGGVGARRRRRGVERRHGVGVVVGHGDGKVVGRGEAAVACDVMADDDGGVAAVLVLPGGDDDVLEPVPVGGGKDRGTGDEDAAAGRDARRDDDGAGGGGVQPHGIFDRAAFGDDEGGGRDEHRRHGRRDRQAESRPVAREVVGRLSHAGQVGETQRDGHRQVGRRAERLTGAPACCEGGGARGTVVATPCHLDGQRGGLLEDEPRPALSPLLQFNAQRERAARIAVQGKLRQGQPVEQTIGQSAQLVVAQVQATQPAQPTEVLALEHVKPLAAHVKPRDAAQVVGGDVCTGGRADGCQEGFAHGRGPPADRRHDLDGEGETGGVAVGVGGDPGVGTGRGHTRRCAGQRAGGGVYAQPGGQGGGQGIGQQAPAADGRRQGHGRNRAAHAIHLRRNPQQAEPGHGGGVIVTHLDDQVGGCGDVAVAVDVMADGDTLIRAVLVIVRHDDDGLSGVPVCGGEDQRRGHRHRPGGADDRGDRDVAGRRGVQPHGVGCRAAFGDGKGGGGDVHPGIVRDDAQLETGVVASRGGALAL